MGSSVSLTTPCATNSLIGLVDPGTRATEVMVEQQYERKYWEGEPTTGEPTTRRICPGLGAGRACVLFWTATLRVAIAPVPRNPATVAYVNGFRTTNLHAEVGAFRSSPDETGQRRPRRERHHNKMVLVTTNGGSKGYAYNRYQLGSLNSAKNNREYGFADTVECRIYQYYKDVFDR